MKRIIQIAFICFLSSCCSYGQADTGFHLLKVLKGDIVKFTVDNLDNVYILTSRNQVKKFNANGDSVGVYNDVKKFGQASLIDVSNPLKVLLYYRDFATVVMLDRYLNAVNIVDLRKQNILQARAIGQSYDNKIWVYDEMESKLKKIDENGALIQETADLRLLLGKAISPVKIMDENKYVYLYDLDKGIFVFDYFGALKNGILIDHWQNLKVTDKYIFGSRDDSVYRYEIKTFLYDQWKMPVPISGSSAFNFTSDRIFALKNEGADKSSSLYIYTIK